MSTPTRTPSARIAALMADWQEDDDDDDAEQWAFNWPGHEENFDPVMEELYIHQQRQERENEELKRAMASRTPEEMQHDKLQEACEENQLHLDLRIFLAHQLKARVIPQQLILQIATLILRHLHC